MFINLPTAVWVQVFLTNTNNLQRGLFDTQIGS